MFFESIAYAMGAAPQGAEGQGNPLMSMAPLVLMVAIFYFLLIRPQQKKAKEHKELLNNLKRGDYVLTNGGMYGRIDAVDGDVLTVALADNLLVKVNRGYVASVTEPLKDGGKKKGKSGE